MKKAAYDEEENERSALLAAIRAQSNSGRLKKVNYSLSCSCIHHSISVNSKVMVGR